MSSISTISVLLATYSVSGVPRVQLNLLHGLSARGFLVELVLVTGSLPKQERDALPANSRVVEIGKSRVAAALPSLIAYFRSATPTGVISAETHLNVIAVSALRASCVRAAISVSTHVPPSLQGSQAIWRKGRWTSMLASKVYPQADAVVAISSGMADSMAEVLSFPREQIHLIHNPVVSDAMLKKAAQLSCLLDEHDSRAVVLGVGRLYPGKGFLDLIEAFALLSAVRNVRLIILGEGPQREDLEARVRKLGLEDDVLLPGAVSNPYSCMGKASLFVLPSYFEGLPTVLIEALACGTPVVATDCPTGPSEILQNGRYGELVPMRNPEALAAAMLRTLDAPLDSKVLKERGMDFHVNRITEQYLDALGLL